MAILKDTLSLKQFIGDFISPDGIALGFRIKNNKPYIHSNDQDFLLAKETTDTFSVFIAPQIKLRLYEKTKNQPAVDFIDESGQVHPMEKYKNDTTLTMQQLEVYAGIYECPELDCRYGIIAKDGQLYLTNNKYSDTKLTLLGEDHLKDDFWWMSHLLITRDAKTKITGFEVNDGRVMHLKFVKIK